MKMTYQKPEIQVVHYEYQDIITTSEILAATVGTPIEDGEDKKQSDTLSINDWNQLFQ